MCSSDSDPDEDPKDRKTRVKVERAAKKEADAAERERYLEALREEARLQNKKFRKPDKEALELEALGTKKFPTLQAMSSMMQRKVYKEFEEFDKDEEGVVKDVMINEEKWKVLKWCGWTEQVGGEWKVLKWCGWTEQVGGEWKVLKWCGWTEQVPQPTGIQLQRL